MYKQHTHTHTVHYNETVDGRPLCRDPNSCSALRAGYVQGQGETGSKQSQSPKIHTHSRTHHPHIFTNIHAPYYANAETHTSDTMWQISSYGPKRAFRERARSRLENDSLHLNRREMSVLKIVEYSCALLL